MALEDSLFSIFGVTGLLGLEIGTLVALLLAGSLSATVLEVARVYREYTAQELPRPARKAEQKPMLLPEKAEKIDITKLGHLAARAAEPAKPAEPARPAPIVVPTPPATPSPPVICSSRAAASG